MRATTKSSFWAVSLCLLLVGCASAPPLEPGQPKGAIAYMVSVETSEPGARIEVNDDYVGNAPLTLKVWGDKKRRFRSLGGGHFVIKAYPVQAGQTVQTKRFRTGGAPFAPVDIIPKHLFFDLNLQTVEPVKRYDVNVNQ